MVNGNLHRLHFKIIPHLTIHLKWRNWAYRTVIHGADLAGLRTCRLALKRGVRDYRGVSEPHGPHGP